MSFQDNRQFNYGTFEAQFAVHDSQGLRAGRTYEFGLDLALMTPADKEALKTTVSDRYEGARVQMASQEPLSLGGVSVSSAEVARYEKLELDLDLHATFDNPFNPVSYTHLRAHETVLDLVCRLLLEKKKTTKKQHNYR